MMNTFNEVLELPYLESIAWSLIHSLWQSAILVLIVVITLKKVQKENARLRHFIFFNALMIMLITSVFTWIVVQHNLPKIDPVTSQTVLDISAIPSFHSAQEVIQATADSLLYLKLFIVFWISGVLLLSLRFLLGGIYLSRLRMVGKQEIDEVLIRHWNKMMKEIGLGQKVKVFSSTLVDAPLTYGFFRPVILIPASLITTFPIEQLDLILMHEIMHIKRRDYLINIVQSIIEIIFFFNPFVWWISNRLRQERENCCDDGVVEHTDPILYAKTLTEIESNRILINKQQLYMSASNNKNFLLKRIQRIMKTKKHKKNLASRLIVALILVLSLGLISWIAPNNTKWEDANFDHVKELKTDFDQLKKLESLNSSGKLNTLDKLESLNRLRSLKNLSSLKKLAKLKKPQDLPKQLLVAPDSTEDYKEMIKRMEERLIAAEARIKELEARELSFNFDSKQMDFDSLNLNFSHNFNFSELEDLFESYENVIWAGDWDFDSLEALKNYKFHFDFDEEELSLANEALQEAYEALKESEIQASKIHKKEMVKALKAIEEASAELKEADQQIIIAGEEIKIVSKNLKEIKKELVKDKLIKKNEDYSIEITDEEMFLNGEKQSEEVFKKYKKMAGDRSFKVIDGR